MNKKVIWFTVMLFSSVQVFAEASQLSDTKCQPLLSEDYLQPIYMEPDFHSKPIRNWEGWDYRKLAAKTDLNKDGNKENVWVLANVTKGKNKNDWYWDDGQRWAVVIQGKEGKQTLAFLGWVQWDIIEPKIIKLKDGNKKIQFSITYENSYEENQIVYLIETYDIFYRQVGKVEVCKKITYKKVSKKK